MSDSALRPRPIPMKVIVSLTAVAMAVLAFICADLLWQTRVDVERQLDEAAANIAQALDREVARTVEVLDLSLRGAMEARVMPVFPTLPAEVQQVMLFDRATTASYVGVILILDKNGEVVFDSRMTPAPKANLADRDYFLAHKADPSPGLRIGDPVKSRLSGLSILPLTRRIVDPDGSFGGVVVGALDLGYFDRLLSSFRLGAHASLTVFKSDSTVVARYPRGPADVGSKLPQAELFKLFPAQRMGHYYANSIDGFSRLYNFSRIGALPLVVNVGVAQADIDARWWERAKGLAVTMSLLGLLVVILTVFLGRELHARFSAEKQLLKAAMTDPLTGLANRRAFVSACERAWAEHVNAGGCILMVDVDRFKDFNDRHGHSLGDAALVAVAEALRDCCRAGDVVARHGGEEFAVLLDRVSGDVGLEVAERVRVAISQSLIKSEKGEILRVTASVGLATRVAGEAWPDTLRRADAALYAAKASGRNRVISFGGPDAARLSNGDLAA